MAYTEAQWNRIQLNLPPEDRVSYAQYIRSIGGTLEQFRTAESAATTPAPVSVSAAESAAAARAATPAKTTSIGNTLAATALRKLQSGQTLTEEEKAALGLPTQASIAAKAEADRIAAEKAAADKAAADKAAADKAAQEAADKAAADKAAKDAADKAAVDKAAQEAADKAAADAAAKAAAEAAAKAEADKIAAEKAIADAKTTQELADAKAALLKAQKDAAYAAAAAKDAADKAEAALKAAKDKADADLKAALEAKDAEATAAAKAAKDAADKALQDAKDAAATAAAEATAKTAASNLNVAGDVVTPFAGKTAADIAAQAEANRLAEAAALKESQRQDTIKILTDRFTKYNLGGLAKKIQDLAIDGATEATITLSLQETEEYKTRFKANEERIKKGLSVLTPAEYLNVEDGYRQVLRAYGLKQFDTDAYVSQFIANDMSANELSNRVVTAVQRVQNADPAIMSQLKNYYGIGSNDLVAYVLDPEQQFQKIQRQVSAAEIGVAAAKQGLQSNVAVSEQLAAQGITQAEAQKGYATIADILPTAEKLSSIYGTTMEGYGQSEGEQEVFNQLASAQRKRQALSAREIAQFSGTSGVNKTSLTTQTKGTF